MHPLVHAMRLATADEAKTIMEEAEKWYSTTIMWSSAGFAAKTAVAEYIANQRGLTLYEAHLKRKN